MTEACMFQKKAIKKNIAKYKSQAIILSSQLFNEGYWFSLFSHATALIIYINFKNVKFQLWP